MADTFHRTPGDQTAYGYRQLPGAGPARGPELKTMVYATVGVALGIVVGTLFADGSLSATNLFASHQPVKAGSSTAGVASHPVAKSAPAPLLAVDQKASTGKTLEPGQGVAPGTQAATMKAVNAASAAPATQTSLATKAGQAVPSAKVPPANQMASLAKPPVLPIASLGQKVSIGHKHRLLHRLTGRLRRAGRRKGHMRHRLHPVLKEAVMLNQPRDVEMPKFAAAPAPFVFSVEGNVTVASFDAMTGTIDTYEGETFALDKGASAGTTISWLDYPPDIHYRCDQSWKCTLIRDGRVVLNVRRTR